MLALCEDAQNQSLPAASGKYPGNPDRGFLGLGAVGAVSCAPTTDMVLIFICAVKFPINDEGPPVSVLLFLSI